MFPLNDLRVLILEENNLVDLTVNSLHKNMPTVPYTVVPCEPGNRFPTTFKHIKGVTLVLRSGLVVNKGVEIPDSILNFPLCISRRGVYVTDNRLKLHYPLVDKNITEGLIDLSIFLINPEKWDSIPESDRGVIPTKKLYMPRSMNHKDDVLFKEEAVATIDALHYGIEGENAFIYNYVECIEKDNINVLETYAYHFEKLLLYLDGVPNKENSRIEYLGNLSKTRISKMRKALYDIR